MLGSPEVPGYCRDKRDVEVHMQRYRTEITPRIYNYHL